MINLKGKIFFDIILSILFIFLMNVATTGLFLHEVLGIIIFLLFIIHKIFNFDWINQVGKRIFSPKLNKNNKIKFYVDVLLLIAITICSLSGVFISKFLFSYFNLENQSFWFDVHSLSAYLSLALISIHIGLHWQMIMYAFRKMFRIKKVSLLRKILLRAITVLLVILGIVATINDNIFTKLNLFNSDNKENLSKKIEDMFKAKIVFAGEYAVNEGESLNDFLSRLICTSCPRGCYLISPHCGRGENEQSEATAYYEQQADAGAEAEESLNENQEDSSNNTDTIEEQEEQELIILDDEEGNYSNIFLNTIPVMSLYICGTYYALKIVGKKNS